MSHSDEDIVRVAGREYPVMLDIEEVVELLQVAPATLYAWRRRSYGPKSVKHGRRLRYERASVRAFMEEGSPMGDQR